MGRDEAISIESSDIETPIMIDCLINNRYVLKRIAERMLNNTINGDDE